MALTPQQIDTALNTTSTEKSKTRQKVDQLIYDFSTGQGVLPTVASGAVAVPMMLANIKSKDVPSKIIDL